MSLTAIWKRRVDQRAQARAPKSVQRRMCCIQDAVGSELDELGKQLHLPCIQWADRPKTNDNIYRTQLMHRVKDTLDALALEAGIAARKEALNALAPMLGVGRGVFVHSGRWVPEDNVSLHKRLCEIVNDWFNGDVTEVL